MLPATRYPEITVSGPPRELGRQHGEAARELIRAFCDTAMEQVNRTLRVSRDTALQVAKESHRFVDRYSADMAEELHGIAEGAGVSVDEIMLLQIRNQLQPEAVEGCTSLSSAGPAARIVAQNWDNDPSLDPLTVVLTRKPRDKPAVTTVGQAGLIAYIGFNEAGIGLCLNTLPAPSRRVGVPHYFLVRAIYETASLDEAVEVVRRAPRAIPANVMLMTPQGPADLEITIDEVRVLTDESSRCVTHTNHCLHPDLTPINEQFPELIQSHARIRRIGDLIGTNGEEVSRESVQQGLRDHQDYPRSICRHANDDPVHGFWSTVFSVIIEPHQQRMHITRGTPCDHPYETYTMP
ncbi:MAG: peptidase C45 [Planctomycetaceae bacterium]|nr:peptidase C45 [Planctomycetaceae bacterium]